MHRLFKCILRVCSPKMKLFVPCERILACKWTMTLLADKWF
jgi:hypothetical protein